ncbi:MAG: methyltransferase [Candidatus Binatia bacterium]
MIDPTSLFRARDGLYAADMLVAAVADLDVFSWLAARDANFSELCQGLGLAERPADVMCTLLCSMGLLDRDGDRLRPTKLALEHLVEGARGNLRPYVASLAERPPCRELVQVLRTGEPAAWASGGTEEWQTRMRDPGFAKRCTAAMDARGSVLAPLLAEVLDLRGRRRLLDVAGGSGIYACTLVDRYPGLRATVLERPPVDEAARTLIATRGLSGRVEVMGGDMFADPFPAGWDVHLYSHVLHDWDEASVSELLRASFHALEPGGLLVDFDVHIDRDKRGPLAAAEYSVLLIHSTRGKCWSLGELEGPLAAAGFVDAASAPVGVYRSIITARKAGCS